MLGGESAKQVLRNAAPSAHVTKREWIAEALSQVESAAADDRQ